MSNSVSGHINEDLFNKLDYQRILIGLENGHKPYKLLNKNEICFKYTGTIKEINLFEKKWQEIEEEELSKFVQKDYTLIEKIFCKLGNKLNLNIFPIAKITNKGQTKIFTLYKNGDILINDLTKKEKIKDKIIYFDEEFKKEFKIALGKSNTN